jgi:hypothetical protein
MPSTNNIYKSFKKFTSYVIQMNEKESNLFLKKMGLADATSGKDITIDKLYEDFKGYNVGGYDSATMFRDLYKSYRVVSQGLLDSIENFMQDKIKNGEYVRGTGVKFDGANPEARLISEIFSGLHAINYLHQKDGDESIDSVKKSTTSRFTRTTSHDVDQRAVEKLRENFQKIAGSIYTVEALLSTYDSIDEKNEAEAAYVEEVLDTKSETDAKIKAILSDPNNYEASQIQTLADRSPVDCRTGIDYADSRLATKGSSNYSLLTLIPLYDSVTDQLEDLTDDERESLEEDIENGTENNKTQYDSVTQAFEDAQDDLP